MVEDLSPIETITCPARSLSLGFSATVTDKIEFPDADDGDNVIHVSSVLAFHVPSVIISTVCVSCLSSKFSTVVFTSKVFPAWVTVMATSILKPLCVMWITPERFAVFGLSCAVTFTLPSPSPLPGETVIHEGTEETVHEVLLRTANSWLPPLAVKDSSVRSVSIYIPL